MIGAIRSWLLPIFCRASLLATSLLLLITSWAHAAEEEVDESGRWATSYLLVMLCIILGLAAILAPSRRTSEIKQPVHEEE